jgi:hypothetical protein
MYASSVGRSTGGEAEEQTATTTISISLPLLFCLPNEKGQNFWQEIQKNAFKYASFKVTAKTKPIGDMVTDAPLPLGELFQLRIQKQAEQPPNLQTQFHPYTKVQVVRKK